MSAAALGMSTNGWVWLVQDANGSLGVVPTFGPGTVLVRNRLNRSPFFSPLVGEEMPDPRLFPQDEGSPSPTATSPLSGNTVRRTHDAPTDKSRNPPTRSFNQAPSYSPGTLNIFSQHIADFSKIGDVLSPLFCISVHEHAWLSSGYGVWGKEEYLKRFWSVLDWAKVSRTSDHWLSSAIQQ